MLKAALTLLAAILFAGGSLASNEFGGFDPNRFPIPQENPPLQPVGFAFSIWLPIYCWLIASGLYGVAKRVEDKTWQDFRIPLIISMLVGAPWLKVAIVSPLWSTAMIWVMLFFALSALWRAPQEDFGWARGPVGLYAGWLTAASAVGSSVVLSGYGLLGEMTAAILMLVIALALALSIIYKSRLWTPSYGFGILWALVGITIKSISLSNPTMTALSILGSILLIGAMWKKRNRVSTGD